MIPESNTIRGHSRYTRLSLGQRAKGLETAVTRWFATSGRAFPWRQTSDPFHIFVAEVLLRQTQATRVEEPYLELISRYPDTYALSKANVDELRTWFKPLGLIRRADCLVQAAQVLVDSYSGQVPNDLEALMALPGIGAYSSRAILCLAFGAPVPMIDEGSGRVLRRALGMTPRGAAYSDRELLQAAEAIIPKAFSKEFNLGLIDIAAGYCHYHSPACAQCPLLDICVSHLQE